MSVRPFDYPAFFICFFPWPKRLVLSSSISCKKSFSFFFFLFAEICLTSLDANEKRIHFINLQYSTSLHSNSLFYACLIEKGFNTQLNSSIATSNECTVKQTVMNIDELSTQWVRRYNKPREIKDSIEGTNSLK